MSSGEILFYFGVKDFCSFEHGLGCQSQSFFVSIERFAQKIGI